MHTLEFLVPDTAQSQRLDRWLTELLPDQSRSRVATWIREGRVLADGRVLRPSAKLRGITQVLVTVPPPPPVTPIPQAMDLKIVYADDDLVVVDKPAGLVVHPGAGHADGTLVNGLLHAFEVLSPIGAPIRPGIVHRIDAGTSGLLVAARTEKAHHHLAKQFAAHTVERVYHALVWDHKLPDSGTHTTLYGRDRNDRRRFTGQVETGKRAVTHWEVMARLRPCAWVAIRLETGRTHQIRVHFSEAGNPLVGDQMYGRKRRIERPIRLRQMGFEMGLTRQGLHAAVLGFEHPNGENLRFESTCPPDITTVRDALGVV